MKYVALLRGINVGKSVQVPMAALKTLLADMGMTGVASYLNSGNVIFESDQERQALQDVLEGELLKAYGQRIPTLVKTGPEIISIAQSIPAEWGNNPAEQTYVAYLFKSAARPEIVNELPVKKAFMSIYYAHECLVWNIKRENYNRSQITKIAAHPAYGLMTTRNVNTARKLAELCS